MKPFTKNVKAFQVLTKAPSQMLDWVWDTPPISCFSLIILVYGRIIAKTEIMEFVF